MRTSLGSVGSKILRDEREAHPSVLDRAGDVIRGSYDEADSELRMTGLLRPWSLE